MGIEDFLHRRLIEHVIEMLQAPTWPATRRVIEEHDDLLTSAADQVLVRLVEEYRVRGDDRAVTEIEDVRTLLRRCVEVGVDRAFAERLDEDDDHTPQDLRSLVEEAAAAEDRYLEARDVAFLEAARVAIGEALAHPALATVSLTFRRRVLNHAGSVALRRYRVTGDLADLETTQRHWEAAVALPGGNPSDRVVDESNLGIALRGNRGRSTPAHP
jgi:hypothetical protein